ncbi:MAG TPA: XRE family transcriptional regulator, partial [Chloroflexota bacterium]|nr:XRE family transcriptional regulator [Chloroflexota bacterium]
GRVLYRLRMQHGVTLRDVAEATNLSTSFLSAVERGASDIALGRLERIAAYFGHDLGSLLGYSARRAKPQYVRPHDRVLVDRGPGIRYEVLRLPGVEMELMITELDPGAAFEDEQVHEGIDIMLVTRGEVVLNLQGADYAVREGECVVWSGAYRHRIRNDSAAPASEIAISTEHLY